MNIWHETVEVEPARPAVEKDRIIMELDMDEAAFVLMALGQINSYEVILRAGYHFISPFDKLRHIVESDPSGASIRSELEQARIAWEKEHDAKMTAAPQWAKEL